MKEKLTPKQKKFALEFLISGNITDAAKNAGYSERSARQIGSLNLTKPNVVEYMNEILDKTKSEEVATTEEVLEFLTSVMRGNVAEQFGLDPAIADRTKAAQLLMKRFNDDQRMDLELTKLEIRFKENMPGEQEQDNFLDALNITARGEDLVLLLRAAVLTNEDIAAELFTCLKLGIGYDVMYKKNWIPMQRKDFQGYRRKTLETVERLLLMRDIEMEE